MEHDLVTARQSGENFRATRVAVADLYSRAVCAPISKRQDCPVIALSEQRAKRDGKRIVGRAAH